MSALGRACSGCVRNRPESFGSSQEVVGSSPAWVTPLAAFGVSFGVRIVCEVNQQRG